MSVDSQSLEFESSKSPGMKIPQIIIRKAPSKKQEKRLSKEYRDSPLLASPPLENKQKLTSLKNLFNGLTLSSTSKDNTPKVNDEGEQNKIEQFYM